MLPVIVGGLAVLILTYLYFVKMSGGPPGPRGLPIVGSIPFLGSELHESFRALGERYGDVFSLRLGSMPVVVINSLQAAREALVEKGDCFYGRPKNFSPTLTHGGKSLALSTVYETNKSLKKLMSDSVKKYTSQGIGIAENFIHIEAKWFTNEVLKSSNQGIDLESLISETVTVFYFQMVYGECVDVHTDGRIKDFKKACYLVQNFQSTGKIIDSLPWTKCFFRSKIEQMKRETRQALSDVHLFEIRRHQDSLSPETCRDLTDAVLQVHAEMMQKDSTYSLPDDQLPGIMSEFSSVAYFSIMYAIHWFFLYMTAFPDIQRKLYEEISQTIGNRKPSADDLSKLPYTEATIMETLRYSSVVPFYVPHRTMKDTVLKGYKIKEGTVVFINCYAINNDSSIWTDPKKFKPDRFMNDDGEFVSGSCSVPFGMGERACIGGHLAKLKIFLFIVGVLQQCEFKKVENQDYDLTGMFTLTLKPKPMKVLVSRRANQET